MLDIKALRLEWQELAQKYADLVRGRPYVRQSFRAAVEAVMEGEGLMEVVEDWMYAARKVVEQVECDVNGICWTCKAARCPDGCCCAC